MTHLDPRLIRVSELLRPGIPIPTIIQPVDRPGPTRIRELQSLGAIPTYAARLLQQIHADVPNDALQRIDHSGAVQRIWYDEPAYAFQDDLVLAAQALAPQANPLRSTPKEIEARARQRIEQVGPTHLSTDAGGGSHLRSYLGAMGPVSVPHGSALFTLDDVRAFTHSKELSDAGLTGKGVTVAVLDTGIDPTHPMMEGQVKSAQSFTGEPIDALRQGHGDWCASAIAGLPVEYHGKVERLRGRTLQGMAPDAKLMDMRVLTAEGCLPGAMMVMVPGGWKRISRVRPGDTVYSYNEALRVIEADTVIAVSKRPAKTLIRIECQEGHVALATENHPFLVEFGNERHWVRADEIRPNVSLVGVDCEPKHRVPYNYTALKARRAMQKGPANHQYRRVGLPCVQCGRVVPIQPSRARRGEFRYCSMACKSAAYRAKWSGSFGKGGWVQPKRGGTPWNKGRPMSEELRAKPLATRMGECAAEIAALARPAVIDPVVKSVKRVRASGQVYDLEMARNHNFVANGLIVHNSGLTSWIIQATEAAVLAGANIISMSLGSLVGGGGVTPDAQAVNEAARRGVLCCVASGNSFGFGTVGSPGSAEGAITVGSVAMKARPGSVSTFSSKGPSAGRIKPNVAAPGGNVGPHNTTLDETILGAASGVIAAESGDPPGYALLRGTSMATPVLAGILAQVYGSGLPRDRAQVEQVLAQSTTGNRIPVKNNRVGWGAIDASRLLDALRRPATAAVRGATRFFEGRRRPILGALRSGASMLAPQSAPTTDLIRIGVI